MKHLFLRKFFFVKVKSAAEKWALICHLFGSLKTIKIGGVIIAGSAVVMIYQSILYHCFSAEYNSCYPYFSHYSLMKHQCNLQQY